MHYYDEFVDAPWGKICVVRAGYEGKPLVFLHGLNDNAGGLQSLANLIRPSYKCYIIELPGCGYSDPYPPGLPLEFIQFVEVIKIVTNYYQLDKYYFIGHSMGMQIGLLYNQLYPGRMERIVALDSLVYPPIDAGNFATWYESYIAHYYEPETYKKRTSSIDNGPTYTYEQALALITKARGLPDESARLILNRSLKHTGVSDKFRFTWDQRYKCVISPAFSTEFEIEFFGNISIPYFLVLADKSVYRRIQLMNPKILETFYDNNPHFRIALIEGHHDVHNARPGDVAQLVSQFLVDEIPIPRRDTDRSYLALIELQKKKGYRPLRSKF